MIKKFTIEYHVKRMDRLVMAVALLYRPPLSIFLWLSIIPVLLFCLGSGQGNRIIMGGLAMLFLSPWLSLIFFIPLMFLKKPAKVYSKIEFEHDYILFESERNGLKNRSKLPCNFITNVSYFKNYIIICLKNNKKINIICKRIPEEKIALMKNYMNDLLESRGNVNQ